METYLLKVASLLTIFVLDVRHDVFETIGFIV
jgi:hypothetical protein